MELQRFPHPVWPDGCPWIVRMLVYAGTGILIAATTMTIVGTAVFLLWGLIAGPLWLKWTIGIPAMLTLLTIAGYQFYREEV